MNTRFSHSRNMKADTKCKTALIWGDCRHARSPFGIELVQTTFLSHFIENMVCFRDIAPEICRESQGFLPHAYLAPRWGGSRLTLCGRYFKIWPMTTTDHLQLTFRRAAKIFKDTFSFFAFNVVVQTANEHSSSTNWTVEPLR